MNRASFLLPAVIAGFVLGGCNLFGGNGEDPFVPKPAALHPEADAFVGATSRAYVWKESLRRGNNDSLLSQTTLRVADGGDTLIGDALLPRLELHRVQGDMIFPFSSTVPAPAAALSRLGFRPERVYFDSLEIPDPGPGLPFPETPAIGWRIDTLVGELRLVRFLKRVETIRQGGKRHECWAFAESTFWAGGEAEALLGAGTTWMGATGLVRHRSEWAAFEPPAVTAGSLYRQITAD